MEWRKALQNVEEIPPSHCWTDIEEKLNQDVPLIRQTLAELEVSPPPGQMDSIRERLYPTRSRFLFSRSTAVAAACVSVILGLAVFYVLNSPNQRPPVEASVIKQQPVRIQRTDSPVSSGPENDHAYIYLTNHNGEQVRLSPKLQRLIEQSSQAQDKTISTWQQKLSSSSFMPSGSNFFDIAEMVRMVEEEKR